VDSPVIVGNNFDANTNVSLKHCGYVHVPLFAIENLRTIAADRPVI